MPCTTILAGKLATNDGSTLISRNDDGRFIPKKITVVLPEKQPKKYKSVLSHVRIELPDVPLKYTAAPNADPKKRGLWPACGINEANVAMTATETITTNPRVVGADPYVEYQKAKGGKKEVAGGIGEEDIVALVLPYIHSAREGVERLGKLLEDYGTYEANGIAFCDADEVWWMETIGGHHWIAQRVPDDRVVIMPNQFGMDCFDFEDAEGRKKNCLCSADLSEFVRVHELFTGRDMKNFNPRLAFGSRRDADHIYNTPRAWYLARFFLEKSYRWDGESADYTPESNDIPWSFVPERKVTAEDVRYLLGTHYQGTPYDPYSTTSPLKGKYRSIGVPNTDVCGILQIRGNKPEPLKGVAWISMGGSAFTACFPVYTAVKKMPSYLSSKPESVSTDSMYWHSRLIAALTDAHYASAVLLDERYQDAVSCKSRKLLEEYDAKVLSGEDPAVLTEANQKIADMVKKESDKALLQLVNNASEHMKNRYHRGDN